LRGRSGASLAFYNSVLEGAAQQNPQNPVFEAHQLETKRQQAFKTVLAAPPSPASAVAPTRSAAAESLTSNVE